jgi:hypothetical protein
MTNVEIQMTKLTEHEAIRISSFGLLSTFELRHSDFPWWGSHRSTHPTQLAPLDPPYTTGEPNWAIAAVLGDQERLLGEPLGLVRRAGRGAEPRQVNDDVGLELNEVDAAAACPAR